MFKQLPTTLQGVVSQTVPASAYEVTIDAATASVISAAIGASGWTYVFFKRYTSYEIVKVIKVVGSVLTIVRGLAGTVPQPILAGATVGYTLTLDAVRDIVKTQGIVPLNITATGEASYSNGTLNVRPVQITAKGDLDITVVGSAFTLRDGSVLVVGYEVKHCAPMKLAPFFLTSKLYPTEVSEWIASSTTFNAGVLRIPPHAYPTESMLTTATFISGVLRIAPHAKPIESVITTTTFTSGVLRVAPHVKPIESVVTDVVFNSGTMKVMLFYTNWPADTLQTATTFNSGTLT